jgi:four helix bundle protein
MNGGEDQGKYDLVERTAKFGEAAITFAKKVKRTDESRPLIGQLIRAATSPGANYLEADESGTRKEFRYRISLCKRETKEARYWLRMIVCACPENRDDAAILWQEATELIRIFSAIYRKSNPGDAA